MFTRTKLNSSKPRKAQLMAPPSLPPSEHATSPPSTKPATPSFASHHESRQIRFRPRSCKKTTPPFAASIPPFILFTSTDLAFFLLAKTFKSSDSPAAQTPALLYLFNALHGPPH